MSFCLILRLQFSREQHIKIFMHGNNYLVCACDVAVIAPENARLTGSNLRQKTMKNIASIRTYDDIILLTSILQSSLKVLVNPRELGIRRDLIGNTFLLPLELFRDCIHFFRTHRLVQIALTDGRILHHVAFNAGQT